MHGIDGAGYLILAYLIEKMTWPRKEGTEALGEKLILGLTNPQKPGAGGTPIET